MVDFDTTAARLVAATPEAIIYATHDGVIRLWNNGAEALFGYTADEALGNSLDLIVPERHRKAHWEGWDRVMATGHTRYGAEPLNVPAAKKDGTKLSLEFSITILSDEAGQIEGVAAFLRDVTDAWTEKKALQARIAELDS